MAHRPNILKLATKISLESLTYTGITYDDPEYKLLEPIVDDDMCAIMMHMRLEANRTAEEIARRAKKDLAFTREQLEKLKVAGVIRTREVDGKLCWYYPSGCRASWRACSPTGSSVTNILCWASASSVIPASGWRCWRPSWTWA